MALQISCFWNKAHYSVLYRILESSNSIGPLQRIRLLPDCLYTNPKKPSPEGEIQLSVYNKKTSLWRQEVL